MRRLIIAAVCALSLSACATISPDVRDQNIALAVQSGQVAAILLEQSDRVAPARRAQIRMARIMAADAWTAYQAAKAAGLAPSTAGLTAALAVLTAALDASEPLDGPTDRLSEPLR
jgi:hypothetical protein